MTRADHQARYPQAEHHQALDHQAQDHQARDLNWEGCVNVRDLGGLPTRPGGITRPGAVVRSDCPDRLTEAGRRALVAHGVRTIVDVRLPDEAADLPYHFVQPGDHGVKYVNVSFIIPDTDWPASQRSLAEEYIRSLDVFRPQVGAIARAIAAAPAGGVLIHCAAGKDRTGLIVALLLDLAGVPRDLIAADYALSSDNLRERTLEWLESDPARRAEREAIVLRGTTRPEVVDAVLAHLDEKYGGTEGYLLGAGCQAKHLDRLRARLVEVS